MTQTNDRVPSQRAFGRIQLEARSGKRGEDLIQVFQMVLHVRVSYEDIIKVTDDVLDWETLEDELHEGG